MIDKLRMHFWLLAMDAADWLGRCLRRFGLFCVARASACVDYTGEQRNADDPEPF